MKSELELLEVYDSKITDFEDGDEDEYIDYEAILEQFSDEDLLNEIKRRMS